MGIRNSEQDQDWRVGTLDVRLKEIIGSQSVRSFAQEIGVSETAVRKYLKGGLPALDILMRICDLTGVNVNWLVTGEGPKYPMAYDLKLAKMRKKIKSCMTEDSDAFRAFEIIERNFAESPSHPQVSEQENAALNEFMGNSQMRIVKLFKEYEFLVTGTEGVKPCDSGRSNGLASEFVIVDESDSKSEGAQSRQFAFSRAWLAASDLDADNLKLFTAAGDSMSPTIVSGDTVMIDSSDTVATDGVFAIKFGQAVQIRRLQQRIDGSMLILADNSAYTDEKVAADSLNTIAIVGRIVWVGKQVV